MSSQDQVSRLEDAVDPGLIASRLYESWTTRPDRAPLENDLVHLMRSEGGRIAESWIHSRIQYEVDEFWAGESMAAERREG